MRKESCLMMFAITMWYMIIPGYASPVFDFANTLQALETLGLPRASASDITVGKGKRRGDSPIYYIKMPPMPYFYANNQAPPVIPSIPSHQQKATSNRFHQVDVDFTNNGRPEQIYHWNYKPKVAINPVQTRPPMFHSTDSLYMPSQNDVDNNVDNIIQNSIVLPPGIPIMAMRTAPLKPRKPILTNIKNPFISLNRDFIYNGKPSGLYVWKPKPKANQNKHKHHYFKHFNY